MAPFDHAALKTRAQFDKSLQAQVDQLLGLVYALLVLAIEIALLRAVGMKRRQVRAMVRSESVIIAVFAALGGCVIGTGLGVALASALKRQGITDIVVPFSSLALFLVLSVLLGLFAASWPARRAAKLDVLAAIASQ